MSEIQYKWKQISKPGTKFNRLISRSKQLPQHFVPSKIRSASVADRAMNLQRSQVYSGSMERSVLNLTRQDDSVQKLRIHPKNEIRVEHDQEIQQLRLQIKRLSTLNMVGKQSSRADEAVKKVNDLKKQFLSFKQNVLNELDRQKNLVNQMMKDVFMALQFQLQKFRGKQVTTPQELPKTQQVKSNGIQGKKFQQLKKSLSNEMPLIQKKSSVKKIVDKPLQKKQQTQSRQNKVHLPSPGNQINFDDFVNSIQRLKSQISQMDSLMSNIQEDSKVNEAKQ